MIQNSGIITMEMFFKGLGNKCHLSNVAEINAHKNEIRVN